jgi:hypothetical protein
MVVNRARLWSDDGCLSDHEYRFSKHEDLVEMMTLSVDRSICFMERNVFSLQSATDSCGFQCERFLKSKHKLCTTEKYLHRQVVHWRDRGLNSVRWKAFEQCNWLPTVLMKRVQTYFMRTRSKSI